MRKSTKFLNASLALSAAMFASGNALNLQLSQPQELEVDLLSTPAQTNPSTTSESTQTGSIDPAPATGKPEATQPTKPAVTNQPASPPKQQVLTSDLMPYKYGDIQLQLTTTGGSITDISVLVGDMSYGRDAAYKALIQATVQTQSTNYGNVSGATFTTEAFKLAVQNALAKG
ncbi:MAG: hypothetical protein RLZZ249_1198 [Actinomycetota bacterium]